MRWSCLLEVSGFDEREASSERGWKCARLDAREQGDEKWWSGLRKGQAGRVQSARGAGYEHLHERQVSVQ